MMHYDITIEVYLNANPGVHPCSYILAIKLYTLKMRMFKPEIVLLLVLFLISFGLTVKSELLHVCSVTIED